jgi:hypothetical protein
VNIIYLIFISKSTFACTFDTFAWIPKNKTIPSSIIGRILFLEFIRFMNTNDTTAAYNPRTNGLTERFNQTLCEILRKHAKANPLW